MAISKTYTPFSKGQAYFMQTALLLAVVLVLWLLVVLIFFQSWFLPTEFATVDEPRFGCGTFNKESKIVITDTLTLVGQTLFEANCISCHSAYTDEVVGPGLKGIEERRDSVWIARFVQNSTKVIESGDKYAVELFEKYNKAQMTTFNFTDAEVWAILRYIRFVNTPMH